MSPMASEISRFCSKVRLGRGDVLRLRGTIPGGPVRPWPWPCRGGRPSCRWESNCRRHWNSRFASLRSSAVPLPSSFAREFTICGEPARRLAVFRRRVLQKSVGLAQLGDALRRAARGGWLTAMMCRAWASSWGEAGMGDDLPAKPCRVFVPSRVAAAVPHVVTQLGHRQDQPRRSVGMLLQVRQSGSAAARARSAP